MEFEFACEFHCFGDGLLIVKFLGGVGVNTENDLVADLCGDFEEGFRRVITVGGKSVEVEFHGHIVAARRVTETAEFAGYGFLCEARTNHIGMTNVKEIPRRHTCDRLRDVSRKEKVAALRCIGKNGCSRKFVIKEVLTEQNVIGLEFLQEGHHRLMIVGIVFKFEAAKNTNVIAVFFGKRANAFYIMSRFFGEHTVRRIIVLAGEDVGGVIGKTEHLHSRLDCRLDVFVVVTACVVTTRRMGVIVKGHKS